MFVPCNHCLRRHATHISEVNEEGKPEYLQLCDECHRKLREALDLSQNHVLNPAAAELEIAAQLQSNLLPKRIPRVPGYDLSAWSRPSRDIPGDYYDFIELDSAHLGILVADVSARGLPGSVVMTETRALVRSEAVRTLSPAETLMRVNSVLHEDIKRGMFVTLYYGILDLQKAVLTCVSAGHNPMLVWRKASNNCHLINPNGLALGVDRGSVFDRTLQEEKIQLAQGDRFVLYTDGVVDAMDQHSEPFGMNRFYLRARQLANRNSHEFLSELMAEVTAHRGSAPQHDDITIITGQFSDSA